MKRSTVGASALLYEIANERLKKKKRTYVCFVDFSKCFDTIPRQILFEKLQILGFPYSFCQTLHFIYSNLKSFIKSGVTFTHYFLSSLGVPQGCCLSAILFIIFAYDLGDSFTHPGIPLGNFFIKYLQFADDLVIICESVQELQTQINNLVEYCSKNELKINASKTKVMIFHKGRLPNNDKVDFFIKENKLEVVSDFSYLGFIFTPQLSFSKHISKTNAKARSKIGMLFAKFPIRELPLELAIKLFNIYVVPAYRYGLPIWMSNVSKTSLHQIDTVFLKFLKRYLGVPAYSNNAIVYHVTETTPFSEYLKTIAPSSLGSILVPSELSGYKLQFLDQIPSPEQFNNIKDIPSWFWLSRQLNKLPKSFYKRKNIIKEILDLNHKHQCSQVKFHAKIEQDKCICLQCNTQMSHFHYRFCFPT